MKIEPLVKAIKFATKGKIASSSKTPRNDGKKIRIILLDPRGKRFTQKEVKRLSGYDELVFVCGRYEGVDERIKYYIDEKLSIGDFVLMGGELGALTAMEAVARLIPDVLHHPESAVNESFSNGTNLEHPQYTRPEVFGGHKVPPMLLSGNHGKIEEWRRKNSK